jgi:small conductance mechanosensitive channel
MAIRDLLIELGRNFGAALLVLSLGLVVGSILVKLVRVILGWVGLRHIFVEFIVRAVSFVLLLIVVIMSLDQLGIDTELLFWLLGAIVIGVGIALQNSLRDTAAGLRLLMSQSFEDDDLIEVAGVRGYVEQLNLMNTVIRTFDNRQVTVPNTILVTNVMVNEFTRGTRRIDMIVRIGYQDDIRLARTVLLEVMAQDERVLNEPEPRVHVRELADHAIYLNVRPWVKDEHYWNTMRDLYEAIKIAFDEHGLTMPHQQIDISLEDANTEVTNSSSQTRMSEK